MHGEDLTMTTTEVLATEFVGLPPHFYTSPAWYEFEKEAIFRRSWLYVGRDSEIPEPGDYLAPTLVDEPLIVVRAEDGSLNAFSSVCRHRAAVIAEGPGHCSRVFKCPYHAWTYDHEGYLKGAPGMNRDDIAPQDRMLPQFSVESWHGFIFVNFDPEAEPLAAQLAEVEGFVANYDLESLAMVERPRFDFACNWKTLAENNSECYHCATVHAETHNVAPSRNVVLGQASAIGGPITVVRAKTVEQDVAFHPGGKPFFPILPGLTEEERNHITWIQIMPTFLLGLYHDSAGFMCYLPTGPEAIEIGGAWLFPPSTVRQRRFQETIDMMVAGTQRIAGEDVFATRLVQKGRHSRFANNGMYAALDEGVVELNKWLVSRYLAAGATADDFRPTYQPH